MDPFRLNGQPRFGLFVLFSWLHMLTVTWAFFRSGNPEFGFDLHTVFHLLVWGSYSLIYLIPGLVPAALAQRFLKSKPVFILLLAVIGTSASILLIHTDSVIYDLYNFHFNGFVVNLLMTPGGVESLGGGADTYWSIAMTALGHVLAQAFFWVLCGMAWTKRRAPVRWGVVLMMLVAVMFGERVIYGISDIKYEGVILDTVKVYPFYNRTTFRSLAVKFGMKPALRSEKMNVGQNSQRLNYPNAPVIFDDVKNPPNVVILVAESLRWDRLTPRIMPNTWALAQEGQNFTHHYSGGNGTREGLFGLFYGLYGSYWSSFLHAQKSPLLMDRFQELGYQFDLRTSAKFSYPELNKTLFAKIPLELQHEDFSDKVPAERDQANATALIEFLKNRDHNRPFMSFFFLESTHARYHFPPSAIIAKPYLENLNYASMSRASLKPQIGQLLNRYTNSAYWVDQQVGRIYQELKKQGLLENTIVIVTGDHGEEFLEKGFWGHNSSFVDEQIRTPMVMWMPGLPHQEIQEVSSHLDVATTLLQTLGAPKDTSSYSLGSNLFDIAARPYVVSSDWHSISVITKDLKYRIPYANGVMDNLQPTTLDDVPYSGDAVADVLQKNRPLILDAINNCSIFSQKDKSK